MKNIFQKHSYFSTRRGSILVYSMIILAMMLTIALGMSKVSVTEKKNASTTDASVQSYQTADGGAQKILSGIIGATTGQTIGQVFSTCTGQATIGETTVAGGKYDITFYSEEDGSVKIIACNTPISNIRSVRSVGTYKDTVRAVSVVVVAPMALCDASSPPDAECSFEGLTYVPILGADGEVWLDRNLGAEQPATSSTDVDAYGWLYQWGRKSDDHQFTNPVSSVSASRSSTDDVDDPTDTGGANNNGKFIITSSAPNDWRIGQNNSLWQGAGGTNNPCPPGFRLPTLADWVAVGITNSDSAYALLKLTMAGYRMATTSAPGGQGALGYYWSSDQGVTYSTRSRMFYFWGSGIMTTTETNRAYGASVRCIKN